MLRYICGNVDRSILLTGNRSKELTELFGKHNTVFRGEFYHKVWILSYCDETFNIFTSKKGTSIEIVCNYSDRKESVCLDFTKKLESIL